MKAKTIRKVLIFPIISLVLFNLAFLLQDPGYSIPKIQIIGFIVVIFLFFCTYIFDK